MPKVSLPKVSMPKISIPKISIPKVSLPKLSMPKLSLPKISIPGNFVIILICGVILVAAALALFYTPAGQDLLIKKADVPQPKKIINVPTEPAPDAVVPPAATTEAARPVETIPRYAVLRDPFAVDFGYTKAEKAAPGVASSAPVARPRALSLQGIFISGDVKSALIDDNVVYAGSATSGGYTVSEIRPDSVVLTKKGKTTVLRLK